MVQIKIKAINQSYIVVCSYDDFTECLTALKERLNVCVKSHSGSFEAFFRFSKPLCTNDFLQLLQCMNEIGVIMLGLKQESEKHDLMVLEQNLTSGQTYEFDREVLLLGSIYADTYVKSSESIYCIGTVSGNIDLIHDDCRLCASGFFQANIRICDSVYQNVTSFAPAQVYYDERNLITKELKEEKMWAVQ
ncbi:MAG: septum site-determining protein MinC [Erysipelotrichaceae bacterium]|nr:septum site-determining protein MinC [Erysipelotrichaceae bacterium]